MNNYMVGWFLLLPKIFLLLTTFTQIAFEREKLELDAWDDLVEEGSDEEVNEVLLSLWVDNNDGANISLPEILSTMFK